MDTILEAFGESDRFPLVLDVSHGGLLLQVSEVAESETHNYALEKIKDAKETRHLVQVSVVTKT